MSIHFEFPHVSGMNWNNLVIIIIFSPFTSTHFHPLGYKICYVISCSFFFHPLGWNVVGEGGGILGRFHNKLRLRNINCRFATFYNRQVMAIVDQLVSGGQVLMTDNESNREYTSESTLLQLDQVPVPKAYVGQTFEQLFLGMLRYEGCLALGLYRARGNKGSVSAFVSTNPQPTELLESTDLVYILH